MIYPISTKKKTPADILTDCKYLETSLPHNTNKDIDADGLCSELQEVARWLPKAMLPSDVLLSIAQQKLEDCVLNVVVSLRILLTLAVSG